MDCLKTFSNQKIKDMFKIFKLRNLTHWRTSIMGIIGGVLIIAGVLYPDKINPETQETIKSSVNEILISIGALIPIISAIFGSKDG